MRRNVYLSIEKISSFFIKKNRIKEEEREIYEYSFEILLSTVANFAMVLIILLIAKVFVITIFYTAGFMIIRRNAGGFVNKHWSCMLVLLGAYLCLSPLLKLCLLIIV